MKLVWTNLERILYCVQSILINALTLSRILLTIIFNINLLRTENKLLICTFLFVIIALTDFFDGRLARHYNVTSKTGAILDIGADFFFIFSSSFILYLQRLLPLGLIIIITIKFAEFCITSYIINRKFNINRALFFDKTGKFVAILLYLLPLSVLFLHTYIHYRLSDLIIFYIVLLIMCLSVISIYKRMVKLISN